MSIICVGDSITFGYPLGPESSWVELLRVRTGKHLINLGMNGSTSLDMLRRYEYYGTGEEISHVHILGGGNDPLQQMTWAETQRNVQKLVDLVIERKAVPVLGLSTPSCYDPAGGGHFVPDYAMEPLILWKERYREWLRDQYGAAKSLLIVDYYTPMCLPGSTQGDGRYFYDESHLNDKGNALMADIAENTWLA